jgi:hypothetical protein
MGDSRDKVAEALGVSGPHVDRLVEVTATIHELEEQGKLEEAEHVKKELNRSAKKGVAAARRVRNPTLQSRPEPIEPPAPEIDDGRHNLCQLPPGVDPLNSSEPPLPQADREGLAEVQKDLEAVLGSLDKLDAQLRKLLRNPLLTGHLRPWLYPPPRGKFKRNKHLARFTKEVQGFFPKAIGCPRSCKADPICWLCRGRGWIDAKTYEKLTPEQCDRVEVLKVEEQPEKKSS